MRSTGRTMAADTLHIEGLRELQRAFKLADATLHKELRTTLRAVAEPVRADAETLALSGIRRITIPWSRMRVGVTQREVYVAPRQRGQKGRDQRLRRPKFADLLMGRALEPALTQNQPNVIAGVEDLLAEIGRDWERV